MDRRFLSLYETELQHLREVAQEFAQEHPEAAGRLALRGAVECEDPYVERLLEGFAFLAARVRLKLDAQFPRFTQYLLEAIYPDFLAPMPSMAVVQLQPSLGEGTLAQGVAVPRGSPLRANIGRADHTACEYRTAHEVTLWPLEIVEAEYVTRSIHNFGLGPLPREVVAGLRLRLRCTADLTFDKLALGALPVYLHGDPAMHVYEQLLAHAVQLVVRPARRPPPWQERLGRSSLRRVGYDDDQALLPVNLRSFQGYRLLRENFAFPKRFLFVGFAELGPHVRRCEDPELDLFVLLKRDDPRLENAVGPEHFKLFCTPAINLFPKIADRINLEERFPEHRIVIDKTRPLDYEVFQVTQVVGHAAAGEQQSFRPLYACDSRSARDAQRAYFALNREGRRLTTREIRRGARSSYLGTELYVSIVDANEAPYRDDLRQLEVHTLCTHRDLPIRLPVGQARSDFTLPPGAPIDGIRCLDGPSPPRPPHATGESAWRLISHLTMNYLTLEDRSEAEGAVALRDLLRLYADTGDDAVRRQIEGVKSITTRPLPRRVTSWDGLSKAERAKTPYATTFIRGLEALLEFEEATFHGSGDFVLGAVLAEFFARHVSINSFVDTVVSTERGEVVRWTADGSRRAL